MARGSYFWSDAGAPTLAGQVGSGLTWLRTLLVGTAGIAYGAKAALGWTEEYTGTNVACFRNSMGDGGSGCYLWVNDTNATYTRIRMYEAMSALNTGTGATSEYRILKASSSGATPRPWQVEGDGLRLFGTVLGGDTDIPAIADYYGYTTLFGGGNFVPFYPGDPAVFCTGRGSDNGEYAESGPLCVAAETGLASPSGVYTTISRNNLLGAAATAVAGSDPLYFGGGRVYGNAYGYNLPNPGAGAAGRQYAPMYLFANNALRGYLPGVFCPLNKISDVVPIIGDTDTPINTSAPKTLRIMGSGYPRANYVGLLAFDSGEW